MEYPVLVYNNRKYICQPKLMQTMKNGNLCEYVGLGKNLSKPSKYIGKLEKYYYLYKFYEYSVTGLKKFHIEVDYYENVIDCYYYL